MKGKKAVRPKIDTAEENKDQPARAFKRALEAVKAMRAMAPLLEQELRQYVTFARENQSSIWRQSFSSG